jgi:hypothetical protein
MTAESERVKQYLLPNEDVRLACQIRRGFLILSSRRIVILNEKGPTGTNIELVIPYDCVLNIGSEKTDRFGISGRVLDQYGRDTGETKSFEIRAPKGEALFHVQSTVNQCSEVVEKNRSSRPPKLDLSYLEKMPESLTHNAFLDLNTVLRDQPVHDNLVHEAVKFLGNEPFLLEESLRDGNDKENGVLFAAGTRGYYWIRGKKLGRFMSDVIVDTVEWENVRCFTHLWHQKHPLIYATYSHTKGGKATTIEYQWSPTINDDTLSFPWLLQPLNGPWILADVMYRCTGTPLPLSWKSD